MIEVASQPADRRLQVATWDQKDHPFYLEDYGETEPLLDMMYAEVVLPVGDTAMTTAGTPIYEYWWTLGHSGHAPEHHHWWPERPTDHCLWRVPATSPPSSDPSRALERWPPGRHQSSRLSPS